MILTVAQMAVSLFFFFFFFFFFFGRSLKNGWFPVDFALKATKQGIPHTYDFERGYSQNANINMFLSEHGHGDLAA